MQCNIFLCARSRKRSVYAKIDDLYLTQNLSSFMEKVRETSVYWTKLRRDVSFCL